MEFQFSSVHKGFGFVDFLSQIYRTNIEGNNYKKLIDEGLFTREELDLQYECYCSAQFYDLSQEKLSVSQNQQLSEKNAYALGAMVISSDESGMVVGFINPYDQEKISSVESITNSHIKPVIVKEQELRRIIRLTYRKIPLIQSYAEKIPVHEEVAKGIEIINTDTDSRISELAKLIIRDAYEIEASDIHIESSEDKLLVRLRIDGLLQQYAIHNRVISGHLVRYFKLLADVDITEDLRPTEGKKVTLTIDQNEVNLRFSFMPTYYGQSVVVRLLGEASTYKLDSKIHSGAYLSEIRNYLGKSYGMFLISGPTGSGKTTTLYSSVQEVNDGSNKIITLEDPVEAHIPGVNQVQINEVIQYDFAEGIRAALRQDPDILMIGEVRDEVTANMAVRAAITGHLVLATIHARGVVEIPIRLLNLNVDPYLLATALRLNVSQRLVRRICPNCRVPQALTEKERIFVSERFPESIDAPFMRGEGCYYCQNSGFAHREAVFESLHITEEMISHLAANEISRYMQLARGAIRGRTLLDNAFKLALAGDIPLSEVMRMESD